MRRAATALAIIALAALAAGLWLTRAQQADPARFASPGDAAAGEQVFLAAGCASCHYAPRAEGGDRLVLAGGQQFASDFGTFTAPNISPDLRHGIGAWTLPQFASALRFGTSPQGQHYYPAFPYTSYTRMTDTQIADLWAYMQTLPPDATPSQPHDIAFPFSIRRAVGFWKRLYLRPGWITPDSPDPQITRGRELVEALGHCAECHTPRDALGGLKTDAWLAGAPNPTGRGTIPALTPDKLDWAASDIAYFLETGFTPDFDSAGGHMVPVIRNFAQLPEEDRAAVAAYLKALP